MRKYLLALIVLPSLFSSCIKNRLPKTCYGIDVSEYQGKINWKKVSKQNALDVTFALIRTTVGSEREDRRFRYNFAKAKENGIIVGAYHFYRANENSSRQASLYIKTVRDAGLGAGDIIPLVDIETCPTIQSEARLRKGLKNWLNIVEKEFGVRPFVYSSCEYMKAKLDDDLTTNYPLWVAAFSENRDDDPYVQKAAIRQYSQWLEIPGIPENKVDGNRMSGELLERFVLE